MSDKTSHKKNKEDPIQADDKSKLNSSASNKDVEDRPSHHHHHHHHHKRAAQQKIGKKMKPFEDDEAGEGNDEPPPKKNSMGEGYAGDMCHEMEISDACTACFCPCITYGQVLEKLDPNVISKRQKNGSSCHVSTGCLLWSGLMGLSLGGIQSLISVPGACNWMPTLYFADLIDARELFLVCSYFVPQCLCHLPLRASIVGSGKQGENICCSCLIASLCCSCSLGSLKSWARGGKFKYKEDDVCMSKCCPCCGAFERVKHAEAEEMVSADHDDDVDDDRGDEGGENDGGEEDDKAPPKQSSNFLYLYNPNLNSMMMGGLPQTRNHFRFSLPQDTSDRGMYSRPLFL